ncbi:MAG: energy-coupling factor ABC transporter permease [Oscillibacter sp.]|nr:energy-coupling factor ABC transporter permease [Oscillibacter sp.]
MHMADALITPAVAGTMYACSALAAAQSVKKNRLEDNPRLAPAMGVMGSFVFAAQMINFTIPGTGSSGHLCGGMLLSAVLGPYAGFLTMIAVLLIQCLVFADGGLLALGCNIWNMAAYGCFLGGLVIWRRFMRGGVTRRKIVAASVLGSVFSLQLGAFSVAVETTLSGVTELPFPVFLGAMLPIHLAIGLVEGVITAAVLVFVYEARPELLWTGTPSGAETVSGTETAGTETAGTETARRGRLSRRAALGALLAAAAVTAGGLSLLASSFPDGLEWSIQRLTGSTELEAAGGAAAAAERIQSVTAFLPDYAFPNSDSALGTSVSGLAGGAIVIALCLAAGYALRLFRHRERAGADR